MDDLPESFDTFAKRAARRVHEFIESERAILEHEMSAFFTQDDQDVLIDILRVAFFASLEQEEGRACTFSLVPFDSSELDNAHGSDWRPLRFTNPHSFNVARVAKLASATDNRFVHILVGRKNGGGLEIIGLARTNMRAHEARVGERKQVWRAGPRVVAIRALRPGTLNVSLEPGPTLAQFSRGRPVEGVDVIADGVVADVLETWASKEGVSADDARKLIRGTLRRVRALQTGGTVLIVPRKEEMRDLDFTYEVDESRALRDALDLISGTLSTWPLTLHAKSFEEDEMAKEHHHAVEEKKQLFFSDVVVFASDLASVDGALVLDSAFCLHGFGAKIATPKEEASSYEAVRALDAKAVDTENGNPLDAAGTRHKSAARFVAAHPGSIGFVVSQDGVVTRIRGVEAAAGHDASVSGTSA